MVSFKTIVTFLMLVVCLGAVFGDVKQNKNTNMSLFWTVSKVMFYKISKCQFCDRNSWVASLFKLCSSQSSNLTYIANSKR